MKKSIIAAVLFIAASVFAPNAIAQKFSGLDKSPMDAASHPSDYKIADKSIKITYSRPQLKGRALADLAPAGKVWRTGANEAPEITFYKSVLFGGKKVPAGTYTLYTIPGEKEWTVILSKDLNVWGAYFYDVKNDVARAQGSVTNSKESLEAFSIAFEEGKDGTVMHMGWSTVRVALPIKISNGPMKK